MKVPHRSLFLAQKYGIELTQDEYLAVLLSDNQADDANSTYKYKEPSLAISLRYAIHWATQVAKQKEVKWP